MAEEPKGTEESKAPSVDLSGMEAKIKATEDKLGELSQTNEQLTKALQETTAQLQNTLLKQTVVPDEDKKSQMKELMYDDPDKAAEIITAKAKKEAVAEMKAVRAEEGQKQAVINSLTVEYPELGDRDNELTKKAIEYYDKMPDADKNSSLSYEVAVRTAAIQLGVLPKAQRDKNKDENFSLSNSQNKNEKKPSKDLDPKTVEMARLMGMDVEDSKVLDGLKKASQREVWGRYRQRGE